MHVIEWSRSLIGAPIGRLICETGQSGSSSASLIYLTGIMPAEEWHAKPREESLVVPLTGPLGRSKLL
jgi:hypothetical protein